MIRAVWLLSLVAVLSLGCAGTGGGTNNGATPKGGACKPRGETQAYTALAISAPMAKITRATVSSYRWTADSVQLTPCSLLGIKKELTLQREAKPQGVLKEVREFYAQDGTLIVRNSEDVTKQLTRSGQYAGRVTLPIPGTAPPGHYRIVSRLMLEHGDKVIPLAQATINFEVVADESAPRSRTVGMNSGRARVLKNGVP